MRYSLFFFFVAIATISFGQIPSDILLEPTSIGTRACPDRNAGTIAVGDFFGQSNDINLNRSFFCINDRLDFVHNGDQEVLDSDPDATTPPGVGYAWYTCNPTVARPTLTDIFTDPCLLTDPQPAMGIYVYVDDINGDATFQNGNQIGGQSIPDFFNNGEPIEIWFAPITIDAVNAGQAVFEGAPSGPCVHANVDAAFSIVYLTPISGRNRRIISDGSGGCLGSFEIAGGLPQFDAIESYTITIEHTTMPGTFATLQGSNYGHQDEVTFFFVEEGTYRVTIEDGKSCGQTFDMDLRCNNPVTFTIGSVTANVGDVVCIPITFEGFTDMGTTSLDIFWDPNIFEYVSNSGFLIDSDPIAQIVDINSANGTIRALWLARNLLIGQTEPDGTVFFEICLRAIGECGESTPVFFGGNIIVADFNNVDLAFLANDGSAAINVGSLTALSDVCPDDGTGTGSIKLTMCGGVAPYTVSFTGPTSGSGPINEQNGMQVISGLQAGVYTFTITDDVGTVTVEMITVPSGTIHDIRLTVDNPTCSYSADGTVDLTISPAGAYDITWSTNEFNTPSITLVENGQYRVTVTDQNGCAVTESVTVNTPPIELVGTVTDATCLSSSNGSITIDARGGSPLYIFHYDNLPPSAPSDDNTRPMLMRGTYRLNVTDANGCTVRDSFTVDALREVVLDDVTIEHATCFGAADGSITIQVSTLGASNDDGYLYEWDYNNMDVSSSFVSTADLAFSGTPMDRNTLTAGRYDVTITDFDEGLDCILDTFFIVEEPARIQMEVLEITPASCDSDDGRFRIRVSGGRSEPGSDLFIDYDAVHSQLIDDFPNQQGLGSDTFNMTIYQTFNGSLDFNCFLDTFVIVERELGPEILAFDSTSVSCGSGMDGELRVFYSPAGQVFDVAWTDQDNTTYTGDRITGLNAGTYTVTVTSTPGCVSVDTVTLGAAQDIIVDSVRYGIPTCPDAFNGNITIFASGPGGGLSYAWSHINGSDNPTLPSVGVGTYSVTITANGSSCAPLVVDTLQIRPPSVFDVNFTGITGATCPGICNGGATINVMGATGTVTLDWGNGEFLPTAAALCAGTVVVTVSDMQCSDTFHVFIPAAESIGLTSEQGNPTCFGDMDGFIRVAPTGSNPPFNVLWNDGPNGPDRLNLDAGLYISTVTDAMGCERIDSFVLDAPTELIASVEPADLAQITCAGRDDGSATITVVGGNGGNIFNWAPNVSQLAAAQNLSPGNYGVTVTDINGCSDEVSFVISEPASILFELGDQSQIQCFGETAQFTVDTAYSGTGAPFVFTVNNGLPHPLGETVNLLGGDYVITVFDSAGCFIDTAITISQPPELAVDIGPDITVTLGDSARLELVNFSGAFPIDSFIWTSSGNDLSCVNCPAPWILPISDGIVNLLVIDSTGCQAQDELLVFVDATRKVYIPNAFSPNNDGINDDFQVYTGLGVRNIEVMNIFNRWGDKVFEGRNLDPSNRGSGGWDGTFKGEPLNPGVYAYVIQVEFQDNKVVTYHGEITLVQ